MTTYVGTSGADDKTSTDNIMYGLDGNDTLVSTSTGVVRIYGGEGADLLDYADGISGNANIYGDSGDDYIDGGSYADSLYGGEGADSLFGWVGSDLLEGGAGDDYMNGQQDDDTLYGGEGSDELIGGSGVDFLDGGNGIDTLNGGDGADTMQGGFGSDTYFVNDAGDRIFESAGQGVSDLVRTSVTYTLAAGQEIEYFYTDFEDGTDAIDLTGNEFAQRIEGNDGANKIDGKGGADVMYGHDGSDTYYVDNAGDTAVELAGEGDDTVVSSVNYTIGDNVENLTLIGATAVTATGNALNNKLFGTNNANELVGLGGADTMTGFGGNDLYYVDSSSDVVVEAANGGADRVKASLSYALGANVENLSLTGSAISGIGNGLNNIIQGTGGSNYLDGGLGSDTLTGGAGADRFTFSTALGTSNIDTITDFEAVGSVDFIRLENAVFVGLPTGALASTAFVISNKAQDTQDRIIYNTNTGDLFYDRDGSNGTYKAVQFAHLDPGLAMTAGDFQVI